MAKYKNILFFAARFIAYAIVLVGLTVIYKYDAGHSTGDIKIQENSLTEIFQEIFVLLVAIGFFIAGRRLRELSPVLNLMALFFLISFIREFNNQIEFWFYIALPFILWFVYLFVKNFKKVWESFERFVKLQSSGSFFIGFLVCYIFSRLYGKTSLWKALLDDSYTRSAKNMAEEGIELLGYAIILISVVELLVLVFSEKKNKTQNT
jgi:hypothetical protein